MRRIVLLALLAVLGPLVWTRSATAQDSEWRAALQQAALAKRARTWARYETAFENFGAYWSNWREALLFARGQASISLRPPWVARPGVQLNNGDTNARLAIARGYIRVPNASVYKGKPVSGWVLNKNIVTRSIPGQKAWNQAILNGLSKQQLVNNIGKGVAASLGRAFMIGTGISLLADSVTADDCFDAYSCLASQNQIVQDLNTVLQGAIPERTRGDIELPTGDESGDGGGTGDPTDTDGNGTSDWGIPCGTEPPGWINPDCDYQGSPQPWPGDPTSPGDSVGYGSDRAVGGDPGPWSGVGGGAIWGGNTGGAGAFGGFSSGAGYGPGIGGGGNTQGSPYGGSPANSNANINLHGGSAGSSLGKHYNGCKVYYVHPDGVREYLGPCLYQ